MTFNRLCLCAIVAFFAIFSADIFAKSVSLQTIYVEVPSESGVLKAEIHFDKRDIAGAIKVKKIIETDLIKVINYFAYVPHNTVHFNLDPYMRLTNGNARVFPTNIINLYNFPANGSDHLVAMEDWLKGLVVHEYIHITHLDQTRDYLKVGENLFGSFAKIVPGIVPRWFTEGIAVWGESYLVAGESGGRLHNPLFNKELLMQFLRADYCETIDCLDDPGLYPNGQLSYWAGAHFIEFLENKKPGTVKCMVETNSGAIPFTLNKSFNNCAGNSAPNLFAEFRNSFTESAIKSENEQSVWGEKIKNYFGSDDFQKGMILEGSDLYKVEHNKKSEALVSYDLEENVGINTMTYNFPIADLTGSLKALSAEGEMTKYLVIAFNEDPHFRDGNRVWKLVDAETLEIEKTLDFKNDPSYVWPLEEGSFITASYNEGHWSIERQKISLTDTKNSIEVTSLAELSGESNISLIKKVGNIFYVKINDQKLTKLYIVDALFSRWIKVYESNQYFDLMSTANSFVIIKENQEIKLFEFSPDNKKMSSTLLDKNVFEHITNLTMSENRLLVLENRLKTKVQSAPDVLSMIKKNAAKPQVVALNSEQPNTFNSQMIDEKTESFPKLSHLKPHYWFLAAGSSENLSSFGAMTSFSDPMDVYTINATLLAYTNDTNNSDVSHKIGGNLTYVQKLVGISDLWFINGIYNQEFSKSDYSSKIIDEREGLIGTGYNFLLKRAIYSPGIYFGASRTIDTFSDRSTASYGLRQILSYEAMSFDDIIQYALLHLRTQYDKPDIGESFLNAQMRLEAETRLSERVDLKILSSYGKLYKTGFSGGVLYGGGESKFQESRWFEFYGVPYSNAYGNEIFTFRAVIEYNFWNIYRGYGFVPFFFKEAHLLFGRESLYADRIYLDNTLLREKAVHAFFAGPRFKMNLFYYVPADIDFIFSRVAHPNGKNINQFSFSINADLF